MAFGFGVGKTPFHYHWWVLAAMAILALPNIGLISQTLGFESIMGVAITVALTLD
jgi:maltose/moltooligosaccharide transporter